MIVFAYLLVKETRPTANRVFFIGSELEPY